MKKQVISLIFTALVATGECIASANVPKGKPQKEVTEGLRFCESTYPHKGGILIANFGTEQLNPLNKEGKGYIVYYKEGKVTTFISADGHLSAPKGMLVKGGYLYICDVNKLVVYNLRDLKQTPQTITFPTDDLFLNDLATTGNKLYISVTNSGRIYTLDISNPKAINNATLVKWLDIAGPNGIIIVGNSRYVASYPADGKTTEKNVIYKIANLKTPQVETFYKVPGQYDGIALSADQKILYISNWTPASITAVNMKTKTPVSLYTDKNLIGPADMTLHNGYLYIPDLPNNRVLIQSVR